MANQIQPPRIQNPIGILRQGPMQASPMGRHLQQQGGGLGADVFATLPFNKLLQDIVTSTQGVEQASGFVLIQLGPLNVTIGTGNPNGVVLGSPPDLYLNTSGGAGTTLYYKSAGIDTTANWVGA